jgi:hypothetical protein
MLMHSLPCSYTIDFHELDAAHTKWCHTKRALTLTMKPFVVLLNRLPEEGHEEVNLKPVTLPVLSAERKHLCWYGVQDRNMPCATGYVTGALCITSITKSTLGRTAVQLLHRLQSQQPSSHGELPALLDPAILQKHCDPHDSP